MFDMYVRAYRVGTVAANEIMSEMSHVLREWLIGCHSEASIVVDWGQSGTSMVVDW